MTRYAAIWDTNTWPWHDYTIHDTHEAADQYARHISPCVGEVAVIPLETESDSTGRSDMPQNTPCAPISAPSSPSRVSADVQRKEQA